MRSGRSWIQHMGVLVLALAFVIGGMDLSRSEAARPYEGTTVKMIVNGEFLKYAMSLIEPALLDTHGIKLEVEVIPGEACQTDEQMIAEIRERGVSNLHPVGTCRMGREVDAVVDPRLRVHGVERLRVADASIMPQVPGGNTNAPSIMIGEKCAAMILEDAAAA